MTKTITLPNGLQIGEDAPLTLIAGPCSIESEDLCLRVAERLCEEAVGRPLQIVFKSSYDKANRSSIHSFRGPGLEKGLQILERVRERFSIPILTDVHTPKEAKIAGSVCDMIQIPAFLCRQTDLLVAAANTPAAVSIKKGQFMSPWGMNNPIEKIRSQGKEDILLIERGTTFGYHNLVVDFRSLPIMKQWGYPVCFDATHSVQLPPGSEETTGGEREFIPALARAAAAVGVEAFYIEVHPHPDEALCDAATMRSLDRLSRLLEEILAIREALHYVPA